MASYDGDLATPIPRVIRPYDSNRVRVYGETEMHEAPAAAHRAQKVVRDVRMFLGFVRGPAKGFRALRDALLTDPEIARAFPTEKRAHE